MRQIWETIKENPALSVLGLFILFACIAALYEVAVHGYGNI